MSLSFMSFVANTMHVGVIIDSILLPYTPWLQNRNQIFKLR